MKSFSTKLTFMFFLLSLLVLFSSCSKKSDSAVTEPEFSGISEPVNPFEQNKLLGRGMNLGNMLEAPFEGDYGQALNEEKYFPIIKAAGFNSIRIPIKWSNKTTSDSSYAIDNNFMLRIKKAVVEALRNNLAVIINIHHFDEIMSDPQGNKQKFLMLWKQISSYFSDYPKELFFEILNEPNDKFTPELWNEFAADAINIIRVDNPYRTLLAGTAVWGGMDGLKQLALPQDENNLIVTVHFYEPFHFTHQGADWVDGAEEWLGTKWGESTADYSNMNTQFEYIKTWGQEHNRPMHIGEFGCFWRADYNSRVKWTAYAAESAISKGMSFAYWEFLAGFGVWIPSTEEWNPDLLNALIPNLP